MTGWRRSCHRLSAAAVLDVDDEGHLRKIIEILETYWFPVSTAPFCEPQLGRRGLYKAMGGDNESVERQMAMLWVLNLADGEHSLQDIAKQSGIGHSRIQEVAELLLEHKLLKR